MPFWPMQNYKGQVMMMMEILIKLWGHNINDNWIHLHIEAHTCRNIYPFCYASCFIINCNICWNYIPSNFFCMMPIFVLLMFKSLFCANWRLWPCVSCDKWRLLSFFDIFVVHGHVICSVHVKYVDCIHVKSRNHIWK